MRLFAAFMLLVVSGCAPTQLGSIRSRAGLSFQVQEGGGVYPWGSPLNGPPDYIVGMKWSF